MAATAAVRFAFDEITHRYTVNGEQIPSVTQILRESGLVDYSGIPEATLHYAAERSVAAHLACHYYDQNDLDPDSLDPVILPYVAAWRQFREDCPLEILASEQSYLGNLDGLQFGMTLDRLVQFKYHPSTETILDIKCTAAIHRWNAVQLAGYAIGLASGKPAKRLARYARLIIHLRKDASYDLHPCEDSNDGEVFAAALRIAHWKMANTRD